MASQDLEDRRDQNPDRSEERCGWVVVLRNTPKRASMAFKSFSIQTPNVASIKVTSSEAMIQNQSAAEDSAADDVSDANSLWDDDGPHPPQSGGFGGGFGGGENDFDMWFLLNVQMLPLTDWFGRRKTDK